MMNSKPFINKINEIKKRMDYVIDNWQPDIEILHQEIRLTFVAYLHGLYENQKVKESAKAYLQKIEKRKRLDSEALLTAIGSAIVINRDFTNYWKT